MSKILPVRYRKNSLQEATVLVDDQDYDMLISTATWYIGRHKKAPVVIGFTESKNGARPMIVLHRFILNAPKGCLVDHINGNPLDNRRENLRIATPSQNSQNRTKRQGTSSKYKGVRWHKGHSKWAADIRAGSKISGMNEHIHLGYFTDEEAAARAYDDAARKFFGEFAKTNF